MKKGLIISICIGLVLSVIIFQAYFGLNKAQETVLDTLELVFTNNQMAMQESLNRLDQARNPEVIQQIKDKMYQLNTASQRDPNAITHINVELSELLGVQKPEKNAQYILVDIEINQKHHTVAFILRKIQGEWKVDPQSVFWLLQVFDEQGSPELHIKTLTGGNAVMTRDRHNFSMALNEYLFELAKR